MKKIILMLSVAFTVFIIYGALQKSASANDINQQRINICGINSEIQLSYATKYKDDVSRLMAFQKRYIADCRAAVLNPRLYIGQRRNDDPCGQALLNLAIATNGYVAALPLVLINQSAASPQAVMQAMQVGRAAGIREIEESIKYFGGGQYCTPKSTVHTTGLELLQNTLQELKEPKGVK